LHNNHIFLKTLNLTVENEVWKKRTTNITPIRGTAALQHTWYMMVWCGGAISTVIKTCMRYNMTRGRCIFPDLYKTHLWSFCMFIQSDLPHCSSVHKRVTQGPVSSKFPAGFLVLQNEPEEKEYNLLLPRNRLGSSTGTPQWQIHNYLNYNREQFKFSMCAKPF
jgi:hypothetical protein